MTKKRKIDDASSSTSTTTFPPSFSSETLKYRLLTGTMLQSGGQKGSLTRCVQKFALLEQQKKQLQKSDGDVTNNNNNNNNNDDDDNNNNGNDVPPSKNKRGGTEELKQELQLYQMELTRLVLLQQTLEKEIQENDNTNINLLQGQIQELADQVQQRSDEADRAKQVQSCFLEYEALARLANSNNQSSSRKLRNEIEQVQNEIREYEKEDEKVDQILKVRTSQFQLLIQHMHDLKRYLFEVEEEQEEVEQEEVEQEEEEDKEEKDD